jgi:hypothetical protein
MPEITAPDASTTHTLPRPSANGTAPPVLPEATKAPTPMRRLAALDRLRVAMTPLRRFVRGSSRRL